MWSRILMQLWQLGISSNLLHGEKGDTGKMHIKYLGEYFFFFSFRNSLPFQNSHELPRKGYSQQLDQYRNSVNKQTFMCAFISQLIVISFLVSARWWLKESFIFFLLKFLLENKIYDQKKKALNIDVKLNSLLLNKLLYNYCIEQEIQQSQHLRSPLCDPPQLKFLPLSQMNHALDFHGNEFLTFIILLPLTYTF